MIKNLTSLKHLFSLSFYLLILVTSNLSSQNLQTPEYEIDSLQSILLKTTSTEERLALYYALSRAYNQMQMDSALYFADKLMVESAPSNTLHKIQGTNEYFKYYFDKRDYKKSDSLNHIIYELAKKIDNKNWLFRSKTTMAASLALRGKLEASLEHFNAAEKLLPVVTHTKHKGDYFQYRGLYHDFNNEFNLALINYFKALEFYEAIEANSAIATIYNNIGIIYYFTEDFENAVLHFEKSLKINRKIKNHKLIGGNLMNIGEVLTAMGDYNKAIKYYKESLAILPLHNQKGQESDLYNGLANAFALKKQRDSSIYYNKLALIEQKKIKDYFGFSISALQLANDYLKKRDLGNASLYLEKAEEVVIKEQLTDQKPQVFNIKAKIDSAKGNYKSALQNYRLAEQLKDSVERVRNLEKVQELQTKYESLEKEKEIDKLNTINKTKELELTKKKYQNYALITASILALILALGWYSRYKTKGKLTQELLEKNRLIASKNKDLSIKSEQLKTRVNEREILVKEIQHRVKNNLQLITSMLNLQGEHSDDKNINDFLEKSQARIASMALVHQTLYLSEEPGSINFNIYLQELIAAIHRSFYGDKKQISYEINSNDYFIDIDKTINIGIIMNEVVSNAFKHAFIGKTSGHVKVDVHKMSERLSVRIADNGSGVLPYKKETSDSFGLKLVKILIEQMNGTLKMDSDGTGFTVDIIITL